MPNLAQNAQEAGLVSGVSLNHAQPYNPQDYNEFDRSADMFQTQRAAEINPVYAQEFNADDIVPIQSIHDLRSFTLKSPLMSDLYMNRSFYQVPIECMYPHTFQPIFKPQVKGNEVPDTALPKFPLSYFNGASVSFMDTLSKVISMGFNSFITKKVFFRQMLLYISVFSRDGILAKLGYGQPDWGADALFEEILGNGFANGITVSYARPSGYTSSVIFKYGASDSFHRYVLMQLMYGKAIITNVDMPDVDSSSAQAYQHLADCLIAVPNFTDVYINLEKVFAYQLICAKFFSNPYVDDINTARKWLLNNETMAYHAISAPIASRYQQLSFTLNGVNYQYDLISNNILTYLLINAFTYNTFSEAVHIESLDVLSNIFEVHQSLRYTDYFVDARTRPLAVGDVYAAVSAQGVSAIDTNKSLWMQRFLNAVGRVPDNMRSYFRAILGVEPDTIEAEPFIISKERFLITGQEIENTSNTDQGNVVTNLRSSQSHFQFEVHVKEPVIIMGLNSYSVKYAYGKAMDKGFEAFTRYDRFNPFLQHIGDQPVLYHELNNDKSKPYYNNTFGYQVRFAEYKSALSHACGGFVADPTLSSWIALYDRVIDFNSSEVMNSRFIRNQNIDFDQFYSSLTGMNPSTYFHFMCRFTTVCHVKSRQQKFPSLL